MVLLLLVLRWAPGLVAGQTMASSDASMSQGFDMITNVIPWGMAAFMAGFVAVHRLPDRRRTWIALLAALLGFGVWTLVRSEGVWGDFSTDYHWRWERPPEERILPEPSRTRPASRLPRPAGNDGPPGP